MGKTAITFLAVIFLGAALAQTNPDCNAELEGLMQHVNKPNVTSEDCSNTRSSIQSLLKTCKSSDPAEYVILTIQFVGYFAPGGVCENTQGPESVCHEVPRCYNYIIGDKNDYSCGEDNANAKNSLKCFQEQIDAGCVELGTKIKGFNEAAAKEYCGYVMASSAGGLMLSASVMAAALIAAMI